MTKSHKRNFGEVVAEANKINSTLKANDFTNQYVHVQTDEGLDARIPSAFVCRYEDWYMIFAEHHAPLVFHKGDVDNIYEYKIITHQSEIRNYVHAD